MSKILICDDDEVISKGINEFISDEGYKTVVINDSRQAVNVLENDSFFAIITDYEMPFVNGGEIITYLKENNINIKKVLISGNDQEEIPENVLEEVCYLKKPIDFRKLLEIIHRS